MKKGRKDNGESILDQPTVLGELYDFQMQLPNVYGFSPAYGILTAVETWRVCWTPQKDVDVDAIAKTTECLPTVGTKFTTQKSLHRPRRRRRPDSLPAKPILLYAISKMRMRALRKKEQCQARSVGSFMSPEYSTEQMVTIWLCVLLQLLCARWPKRRRLHLLTHSTI